MPDESCRNCGGRLKECTQCAECKKVISLICNNCSTRTPEQFHDKCMCNIELVHTPVPKNQAGSYASVAAVA